MDTVQFYKVRNAIMTTYRTKSGPIIMYNKQLQLKADRPISRFATVHKYGSPSTCARVVNSHGLFLGRERLLALHFVIQAVLSPTNVMRYLYVLSPQHVLSLRGNKSCRKVYSPHDLSLHHQHNNNRSFLLPRCVKSVNQCFMSVHINWLRN